MRSTGDAPSGHRVRPRSVGVVLAIACVGQFMVVLDVGIVNVALPAMRSELGLSAGSLQWVVNSYLLTFAGCLLLGGRAADVYGARRIFLIGVVVFTLTSLVGGAAPTGGVLIASRALQGLGAAMIAPATLTIVMTSFAEGAPRHRAIAIWSGVAAVGGTIGVVLGGFLTTYLSWRWNFFINIPIGAILFVGGWRRLVDATQRQLGARLDVAGAITATVGLAFLVYAIIGTKDRAWTNPTTIALLLISAALLGTFIYVEARIAKHPLMPLRFFKNRSVWGADLVMLMVGGMFFTMWYFLSLFLQTGLGYSPLETGLLVAPLSLWVLVSAQASARLVSRWGTRAVLVVGTISAFVGFAGFSRMTADASYFPDIIVPGLFVTFGIGFTFPALATAATNRIPPGDVGVASGLLQTSRQVGGSLALAILGAASTRLTTTLAGGSQPTQAQLSAGYARAFAIAAGVTAVSVVVALIVPQADIGTSDDQTQEAVAASEPS